MTSIQKRTEEIMRNRRKAEPNALHALLEPLLKSMSLLLQRHLIGYTPVPANVSQAVN
jgi:hypothetical protein